MSSQERKNDYIEKLLEQTDRTICPDCYNVNEWSNRSPKRSGFRRMLCQNAVLNRKNKDKGFTNGNTILVCCFLGNEEEQINEKVLWEEKLKLMRLTCDGQMEWTNKH